MPQSLPVLRKGLTDMHSTHVLGGHRSSGAGVHSPLGIFKEVASASHDHSSGKVTDVSHKQPKPAEAGRWGPAQMRRNVAGPPVIYSIVTREDPGSLVQQLQTSQKHRQSPA